MYIQFQFLLKWRYIRQTHRSYISIVKFLFSPLFIFSRKFRSLLDLDSHLTFSAYVRTSMARNFFTTRYFFQRNAAFVTRGRLVTGVAPRGDRPAAPGVLRSTSYWSMRATARVTALSRVGDGGSARWDGRKAFYAAFRRLSDAESQVYVSRQTRVPPSCSLRQQRTSRLAKFISR